MHWQDEDEDEAKARNERAYDQALWARAYMHCPTMILAYGERLARMYYPHLFVQ